MSEPIAFTLTDADGRAHAYECIPHPASRGQKILWQLVALGAEPLARLAKGVLTGEGGLKKLLDDTSALKAVDFSEVGADIKRSVQTMPMEALVKDILALTTRDGKALDAPGAFDAAYTRNYGEMLRAVWEVVKENRFISLLAIS